MVVPVPGVCPFWFLIQFIQEPAFEFCEISGPPSQQHLRLGIVIAKPSRQLADSCELLVSLALSDGRLPGVLGGSFVLWEELFIVAVIY